MDLESLGWTAEWEKKLECWRRKEGRGGGPARVALAQRERYTLYTTEGTVPARLSGLFRHQAQGWGDLPIVGDWVVAEQRAGCEEAIIQGMLPRKNGFARRPPRGPTREQWVAANIDRVFIVTALDPDFSVRRIERYLLLTR